MNLFVGRRAIVAGLSSLLAASMLAACSTPGRSSAEDAGELRQRVETYWSLVKVNDKVGAWKYELASQDQSMTLEAYLKTGGVVYDAIEVRDVRQLAEKEAAAEVWMRFDLPLLRIKGQEATAQDQWRRVDGVWYHVRKRSAMFPDAK